MEIKFEHKKANVEINNKKVAITLYLSIGDYTYLLENYEENYHDLKALMANIVKKHCILTDDNTVTINEILNQSNAIDVFMNGVLKNDDDLRKYYDLITTDLSAYERFIIATREHYTEMAKNLSEAFSKSLIPVFENIAKSTWVSLNIEKMLEPMLQATEKLNNLVRNCINTINKAISNIDIPTISEERKKELTNNYETWGKYGWTSIPDENIDVFSINPGSLKDANAIADKVTNKTFMDDLFNLTLNINGVKKADFEEAVFLYSNKKYKSCAMILFSLIDERLIKMHKKEETYSRKRRSTGAVAARIVLLRLDKEYDLHKKLFCGLTYCNLLSCINEFFKDAEDFKLKTAVINRNLLDHGMMTRRVIKRDCKQLFLLYYNMLEFFEIIESK